MTVSASGIDAADLLALELAPLRMVVPDLLPEGMTVLASPPKVGKSCLVYQLAVEVALGGELLGRRVDPGSVLYLALEDGARRGQDRLRAALAGRTMPRGRLEVRWTSPPIGDGLEEDVTVWLDEHPDTAVVAIDTLQKVRRPTNGKRGAYEVDVDDLGRLQALFRDRRVALVIVHHSRKEAGDDFLASVSGTYGITGSTDSIVVIKRKRMEAFGTIVATGRHPRSRGGGPVRRLPVAPGPAVLARSIVRTRRGLPGHQGGRADLPGGDRRPNRARADERPTHGRAPCGTRRGGPNGRRIHRVRCLYVSSSL